MNYFIKSFALQSTLFGHKIKGGERLLRPALQPKTKTTIHGIIKPPHYELEMNFVVSRPYRIFVSLLEASDPVPKII